MPAIKGASPLGSEGSPSLGARGTALYSFDIWDSKGECPHCGSEDIEYDLEYDWAVCCWCGLHSAEPFYQGWESHMVDEMENYEREISERTDEVQ